MGIPPINELFSTPEEWHAFLMGYFEILAPWPPRYKLDPPAYLKDEQPYYHAGRGCGIISWIGIAKAVQVLFF